MSGMEIPLIIGMVAGTGTQVAGGIMAANSQADAQNRNAALKKLQADELLSRQTINEKIMRDQAEKVAKGYSVGFAASGREGAGIGGMLQIKRDTEENILNSRREAEFKAQMLRSGADIDQSLASDYQTASYITGAGSLLSGGANIYSILNKYKKDDAKDLG